MQVTDLPPSRKKPHGLGPGASKAKNHLTRSHLYRRRTGHQTKKTAQIPFLSKTARYALLQTLRKHKDLQEDHLEDHHLANLLVLQEEVLQAVDHQAAGLQALVAPQTPMLLTGLAPRIQETPKTGLCGANGLRHSLLVS